MMISERSARLAAAEAYHAALSANCDLERLTDMLQDGYPATVLMWAWDTLQDVWRRGHGHYCDLAQRSSKVSEEERYLEMLRCEAELSSQVMATVTGAKR